ncbi:MAG TPA: thioesterase family protein [Chthonomonadaceae bacterium]|nr:thioesterase family protein [Chthonomonadaceae bacterium]
MAEHAPDSPAPQAESLVTPVVYELPLKVTEDDIDARGHANNVVYLRWVQEAATAHWRAGATARQQEDYAWVVARHEIDYLASALAGDDLVARTWVGEAAGARFERFVEIWRPQDDRLLARARSVWVALDGRTGRPRRVDSDLQRRFHAPRAGV